MGITYISIPIKVNKRRTQMQQLTEQNYKNLSREQRGVLIAQKYRITRTEACPELKRNN